MIRVSNCEIILAIFLLFIWSCFFDQWHVDHRFIRVTAVLITTLDATVNFNYFGVLKM